MEERIAFEKVDGGWKVDADGTCKSEEQWRSSMVKHCDKLLKMRAALVDDAAVLSVLAPIWRTIPETAERVRFRIEKVMALAIKAGAYKGENPARYKDHIDALGSRPTKTKAGEKTKASHAAIPYKDMPGFMATIAPSKGNAAKCLQFAILTAARATEARLAK